MAWERATPNGGYLLITAEGGAYEDPTAEVWDLGRYSADGDALYDTGSDTAEATAKYWRHGLTLSAAIAESDAMAVR